MATTKQLIRSLGLDLDKITINDTLDVYYDCDGPWDYQELTTELTMSERYTLANEMLRRWLTYRDNITQGDLIK